MRSIKDNKKAQEFSITTLVVLVLAIIILVLVVLGFWKGWDYIFSKLNVLPDNLEAASQSCGISASQNLETSYCYELKEIKIGGVKQHANCDYLESQAAFTAWEKPCDAIKVKNAAIALCTNNPKLSATYKINTWTCGDLRPTTTPAA